MQSKTGGRDLYLGQLLRSRACQALGEIHGYGQIEPFAQPHDDRPLLGALSRRGRLRLVASDGPHFARPAINQQGQILRLRGLRIVIYPNDHSPAG
jgi:hypothetical protein